MYTHRYNACKDMALKDTTWKFNTQMRRSCLAEVNLQNQARYSKSDLLSDPVLQAGDGGGTVFKYSPSLSLCPSSNWYLT